MRNDTDVPLGYLITFRCYGTWLHGDERGAIDRFHNRYKSPYLPRSDRRRELRGAIDRFHNRYKSPYLPRSDRRRELNERMLKSHPLLLNVDQRQSVEDAVCEVCEYK